MGTDLVAFARVSWGMWVASCPRPDCPSAETIGVCEDGTVGGLTGDRFTCRTTHGGCGLTTAAVWPARVDVIAAILDERPVPRTRNWRPGESIVELIAENLEHGVPVPDLAHGLFLTAAAQYRQIGA